MQQQSTFEVIVENWRGYNDKLIAAVAPLTDEQLRLQPAPGMWPLFQIVQHIAGVRVGWFYFTLQEQDEAMEPYFEWGQYGAAWQSGAELARGLDETWAFIESRMKRWTPEEFAVTFPDEDENGIKHVSRSWVIYHLLEHDLHHGGEVSLILGMNGLQGPDI